MNALFDALGAPGNRPVGLIVWIGAGDGRGLDIPRLAEWAPRRVVLVEGDPDAAADLERRMADQPGVTLRATPVAAQGGRIRWVRHNLPAFNGPVDFEALRPYYPRLRVVEERRPHATALTDLLASLTQGLRPEEHNLLVLDLPGQEDGLLASVQPQRLQEFGTLVLRGCREALPPDGAPSHAVAARLLKLHYLQTRVDDQSEPLWPVTTFVLDVESQRAEARRREQAEAQAAQQRFAARLAELEAEQARWQARAEAAEARAAAALAEQARQAALARQLPTVQDEVKALRAQLQAAQTAAQAAAQAEAQAEIQSQAQRHDQRLAELTRSQETQAQAMLALQAQCEQAEAARALAEQRCNELQAQLEAARQHASRLGEQVQTLEAAHAMQQARHQALQDELQRAEGQIELIKDLLLGESGL